MSSFDPLKDFRNIEVSFYHFLSLAKVPVQDPCLLFLREIGRVELWASKPLYSFSIAYLVLKVGQDTLLILEIAQSKVVDFVCQTLFLYKAVDVRL